MTPAQKETMAMTELGKLIDGEASRDAVHVAVLASVASTKLFPGQPVTADGGSQPESEFIGIVDPFLVSPIYPGERYWIALFPNTVTGMRHHWELESLDAPAPNAIDAESWLREFAEKIGHSYESMMESAREYHELGVYTLDNSETYKDYWDEFKTFWKHWSVVTGEAVSDDESESSFYTCSC